MENTIKQKIQTILIQLNHGLVEREEALKIALLCAISGENIVLIGPPGTGKSMIARKVADCIEQDNDNEYFEYLLTKFSTPEEIFGPLSIAELKADRFKRNTEGYLPTAKIAFLDEIFKASSSILNSLLSILNERIFHNGSKPQKIPLLSLISASNELPTGEGELSALYDRFLVRTFVDYVSDENFRELFAESKESDTYEKLTKDDLSSISKYADKVVVPEHIVDVLQAIWSKHKTEFKEDNREILSDRRLKKVIKFLRFSAATNGRSEVDLSDILLLKNSIWNHNDNIKKVHDIILKTLKRFSVQIPISQDANNNQNAKSELLTPMRKASTGVIKGFNGSGTKDDPIFIASVEDLSDINRTDIGVKDYYFLQTGDIDCSALTHWNQITFKGKYDGDGYKITNMPQNDPYIFAEIQADSEVVNMTLSSCYLAKKAIDAKIYNCKTDKSIAEQVEKCKIDYCFAGDYLISKEAKDCDISRCSSGNHIATSATDCKITLCETTWNSLLKNAKNCTISDCSATIEANGIPEYSRFGCIVWTAKSTTIERCFASGSLTTNNRDVSFGGIAGGIDESSKITGCATGHFTIKGATVKRIVCSIESSTNSTFSSAIFLSIGDSTRIGDSTSPSLNNNFAIDTVKGEDNVNGKDGKTISTALFKQRFFEHTLGFDFENNWEWDDAENIPKLRLSQLEETNGQNGGTNDSAQTEDSLVAQVRANIWL